MSLTINDDLITLKHWTLALHRAERSFSSDTRNYDLKCRAGRHIGSPRRLHPQVLNAHSMLFSAPWSMLTKREGTSVSCQRNYKFQNFSGGGPPDIQLLGPPPLPPQVRLLFFNLLFVRIQSLSAKHSLMIYFTLFTEFITNLLLLNLNKNYYIIITWQHRL